MGGIAVPKDVWRNVLFNASLLGCILGSGPDHLRGDRPIYSPAVFRAGKQIRLGSHPSPVLAERFQQHRTERNTPIHTAFALRDADHHPLTVDIAAVSY